MSSSGPAQSPGAGQNLPLANLTPQQSTSGNTPGSTPAPPLPAQPQQALQQTGAGPSNSSSPANVQSPTAPPPAHTASSSGSQFSLLSPQTWSTLGSTISQISPLEVLGVSFYSETSGGKKTWIIKLTKLAAWFVGFHIGLALIGLLNLASSVYTWISVADSNNEKMIQQILRKVATFEPKLEGMEDTMRKWFNESSTADTTRATEEQNRWTALIKVFEDCAKSPPGRENASSPCNNVRRYFDDHPLPRPDNSNLAKRNLAHLDEVIRRDHLHLPLRESPLERAWYPSHLEYSNVSLSIIFLTALGVLFFFMIWQRYGPEFRRRFRTKQKSKSGDEDEYEKYSVDSEADRSDTTAFASGGDFHTTSESLAHRRGGHRQADPYSVAARGATDELEAMFNANSRIDVDKPDESGEYGTILAAAARSGNERTVNFVLSRRPNLNILGGRYGNAVQAAAHSGNSRVVERLLNEGAKEVEGDNGGFYGSAVGAAAEKGDVEMLDILLNHSSVVSDVNLPGGTFGYPLIAGAQRGDYNLVKILLNHGARAGEPNNTETIALHQAAAKGHAEIVDLLLAGDSPIDQNSVTFGTPLHAACHGKHEDIAWKLLVSGADPSARNQKQRTAVHIAAEVAGGLPKLLRRMLEARPESVNAVDDDGNTALHFASIAGNVEVVKILLECGADCTIGDKFNAQPLFRAAGCGQPEIVEILLKDGAADPDAADCFGRTALHGPAQTADVRVHKHLIERGASVNVVGNDMKTPLHEACNMGRIENVKLLLARREIKINELDNDQFPPLYKALCSSDAHPDYFNKCVDDGIVSLLLERPELNVNASNGVAVQEAARKGFIEFVSKMISDYRADVQLEGGKYGGVLQAAAMSGNVDLVNLLLQPKYHIDVNLPGGEFGCPLSASAAFGHVEIVQRLLEAGAKPNVTGSGRYGSPLQSICRGLDARDKHSRIPKEVQIRLLLEAYGVRDESIDMPYEKYRWNLSPAGWGWMPPGEM